MSLWFLVVCVCAVYQHYTYIECKCHDKLIINWILIGPSLPAGGRKGLHFSPLRITKNICICRDPSPPVCVHNVTAPAPARPQPQRTTIGQTGAGRAAGLGSTQYHHQAGLQCCSRIPPLPREWSLVLVRLQCCSVSPPISPRLLHHI